MATKAELKIEQGNPVIVYGGETYYDIDKITKSHVIFSRPVKTEDNIPVVEVIRITRKRYDDFMNRT